jgi:hypothetical protein
MTLMLIICAWLVLPALAVAAGVKFYVPWFLARHSGPPDELAVRRALRDAPGAAVTQRLWLR